MELTELADRLQSVVADRYRVEGELGRGGMATVFVAEDVRHGRRVAIKVMRPELAAAMGAERFLREVRVAAPLANPHILPLYDSGEGDGLLYYVMPFVEGESLADRLRRDGQLPVDHAVRIARDVAAALTYAHSRGVVHRDIKPANIMLSGDHAIVTDFGIAKALGTAEDNQLTATGLAVGTPAYMSPEQISGTGELDGRSDIYSLGCVLYEMLIGEPPFTGASPMAVMARHSLEQAPSVQTARDTIPEALNDVIDRALAKTPADRFETATAFAAALDDSLFGRVPTGRRTRRAGRRRARFSRTAVVGAGVVVVALAGILIGAGMIQTRGSGLDPDRLAVLPFGTAGSGSDSRLAAAADGMVELLFERFPGNGGPAAVFPGSVRDALPTGGAALSLTDALRVARRLGAGRVLLGQISADGERVVLSATVHDVGTGDPLARVEGLTGGADSTRLLSDRLASELLARLAGEPEERMAQLRATQPAAVREYVAAQAEFAAGAFSAAVTRFGAALDRDSTFAAAALGLTAAAALTGGREGMRGVRLAWESRARLGPLDSTYLAALAGPRYPDWSPGAERLSAWEDAATAMPRARDPWYQLGESLFHSGLWLDAPDAPERADAAFRHALDIDPDFVPALAHLLDLALARGDRGATAELQARYFAADSAGDLADYFRWRAHVASGDEEALARFRARIDSMSPAVLERITSVSQLDAVAMDDAALAAEAMRRQSGLRIGVFWANTKLREIALNGGRLADAAALPRVLMRGRDRLSEVVEALYWDADTTLASQLVRERAPLVDDLSLDPAPREDSRHYDICAVSLWRLARGNVSPLPQAIARLYAVPDGYATSQTAHIGICALLLDAELAARQRRRDAPQLLARLDSVLRSGPGGTSWILAAANLAVARLYERQGDLQRALAAVRRRTYWYDLNERRVLVCLSTFLREEGRLADRAGDARAARAAYEHYLVLRGNAEPSLAASLDSVRAALARLPPSP